MDNAIEIYSQNEPLTAVQIKAQVQRIQEVMKAVMEKDVHYGVIPGTPKPTLYKAGSEKILTTFHVGVDPDTEDLSKYDEVHYRVKAKGFSQATGALLGAGVGECSSEEEKYKWRKPVCDEEFNETPEDRKRIKWVKGFGDKPNYQVKQIRTNPADVANTILKMAKKRAQIDMTLTVTAASDIFEQDLEDIPPEVREGLTGNGKDKKPPITPPGRKSEAAKSTEPAGEKIVLMVDDIRKATGTNKKTNKPWTKFIVKSGDKEYGTFSETFAQIAKDAMQGAVQVEITFTTNSFGNDISDIQIVEPPVEQERERIPGEEG
jgi:hypothetical protein